jgi:hypothetical protein
MYSGTFTVLGGSVKVSGIALLTEQTPLHGRGSKKTIIYRKQDVSRCLFCSVIPKHHSPVLRGAL